MFEDGNPREKAARLARSRADEARHEVGEAFVGAAREYFPEEYAAQQRENVLKSGAAGATLGLIVGLALGRRR